MMIHSKVTDAIKTETDMLAVFAFAGKTDGAIEFSDEAKRVDTALGGMLAEVALAEKFTAKKNTLLLIHTHGKIPAKRVLITGAGHLKALTVSDWQTITASVVRRAKAIAAAAFALAIPRSILDGLGDQHAAWGAAVGLMLGDYTFLKHKNEETRNKEPSITDVLLLVHPSRLSAVARGVARGTIESRAVIFARDLVNEPPSVTTPTYLAEAAKAIARGSSHISCQVFGTSQIEKMGMGGLLGIARGSAEEPKFIHMTYRGSGRKTIALIGKGITFDTGGLSIKSSSGMETMKLDMAGAAAILGVFRVLAELKPNVNVVGLIAATENMPGSRAIKPGDVVRAMNGKTIEILNTDAEGRVILADALSYAAIRVKPDIVIDLATLTGACVVALGEDIAGLFSNTAELTKTIIEASRRSGEKIWELPLERGYRDMIKSAVADVKNSTKTRWAGAITAALFLSEFVPENLSWGHIDIAGPAFAEKGTPLTQTGGTGFGVLTILSLLPSVSP